MAVWDDAEELARWLEQQHGAYYYIFHLNNGAPPEEILEEYLFDHPNVPDPR